MFGAQRMELTTLKEITIDSCGRYSSILSLPRSRGDYYKTILDILSFLSRDERIPIDEYNYWFQTYYGVTIDNCYNSRKILERANLIRLTQDKHVVLTTDGVQCFAPSGDPKFIICRGFLEAFFGLLEILLIISEKPHINRSAIYNLLLERFQDKMGLNRKRQTSLKQFRLLITYLKDFNLIIVNAGKKVTQRRLGIDPIAEKKTPDCIAG